MHSLRALIRTIDTNGPREMVMALFGSVRCEEISEGCMIALPALVTDRALTDPFIQGTSRKRNQADEHDENDGTWRRMMAGRENEESKSRA